MTKTSLDVTSEALRRLGVLSNDEEPGADDYALAKRHLDAALSEFATDPYNFGFAWTAETVPDAVFRPLAWLVAADIASHYGLAAEPRSRPLSRIRAFAFPDDRAIRADLDDSGTVSDDEADADLRAQFY